VMPDQRNKAGSKRNNDAHASSSRKKPKTQHYSVDDLPWKTVKRPQDTGLGGDDGILELEEVEDVEVIYEETDAGRVAKFKVSRIY